MKLSEVSEEDIAKGKCLNDWQGKFMSMFDDELVIVRTGVGAGKSYGLAAWLVLQCCKKPGIRGIIIAQSFDALDKVLVMDIRQRCENMGVYYKYNKNAKEITFANGSKLMCYSAQNPTGLLGLSEIAILAIDEAAYCPEEVYNFAADRMRGSKYSSMIRLISSPQSMAANNWFTNLCKKYPDKVITASSLDNPFSGDKYKENLKERYGEGTDLYRQQVLGELFDTDVASQIIFRKDFPTEKKYEDKLCYMGVDCAGLGADYDSFAVVDKYGVREIVKRNDGDTFVKANLIQTLTDKYQVSKYCVDATGGYGNAIIDLMKEKNILMEPINFSQKAFDKDKHPNARTEMYIELVRAIRNGFWVPDEVRIDMLAMQSSINNKGQLFLLPKELAKKTLGRSPDAADSVALAVYAMNHFANGAADKPADAEKAAEIADKYLKYFSMYN